MSVEYDKISPEAKEYLKKPSNQVLYVHTNYETSKKYNQRRYDNCMENWRFFAAKNPEMGLGQWPSGPAAKMLQQGRRLVQYNFIKPTVEAMAGSLLMMPWDPKYNPIDEEETSLTEALRAAYYYDKDQLDWKTAFFEWILHGLIFEGVLKQVISDRVSPLGNIGYECCLPGSVFPSPAWKSMKSRDCKKVHTETWMSAKAIAEKWPQYKEEIEFEIQRQAIIGDQFGPDTGVIPFGTNDPRWGDLYRVVQEYEMVKKRVINEYLTTENGEVEIPQELKDDEKPAWLNQNFPEWDPLLIYEKPSSVETCVVRSECWLLCEELLENGETETQTGAVPFHFWSALRLNGEPFGLVDAVKDPQLTINYSEAMVLHYLSSQGTGGNRFLDPSKLAPGVEEDFINNANANNKTFKVKPGALEGGSNSIAQPVHAAEFNPEIWNNINSVIKSIWPQVSKITPSFIGRPEQGNPTSGALFKAMKAQGDVLNYTTHYFLRLAMKEVYESWLLQAPNTYGNETYPRHFYHEKKKYSFNEPVDLPGGRKGIRNDVNQLRKIRHQVVISETQETATDRIANVETLSEYSKSLAPDSIGIRAVVEEQIALNVDQFDEQSKAEIKEMARKQKELAAAKIDLAIMQTKAAAQQLQASMTAPQTGLPNGMGAPAPNNNPSAPAENTALPSAGGGV